MREIKKNFTCSCKDDDCVELSVSFGDGQTGSIYAENPLGGFINGSDANHIPIGKGSKLAGLTMVLVSTILKTNTHTQKVSAVYTLHKSEPWEESVQETFGETENRIRFIITLEFKTS